MDRTIALSAAIVLCALPAMAQDWAKDKLDKSPRHHEWVELKRASRSVQAFLVYPETSKKATAVIVIHENRGLTDWVRLAADELAEAGYIAIAPDLLSGMAPGGGNTSDFPQGEATRAISKLPAAQVTADLDAAADYVKKLPSASGKLAVAGFCWGGGQTFDFATHRGDLSAAFVFYGRPPEGALAAIAGPVYGFYGGNDARINSTIGRTKERMKEADKRYEPVIYPGAGHGFMRAGEGPGASAANKQGREEAWKRLTGALSKI